MQTISLAGFLIGHLQHDDIHLETQPYSQIYQEYMQLLGDEIVPSVQAFTYHTDSTISQAASGLLASRYHLSDNWTTLHTVYPETEDMQLRKAATDCIFRLKMRKVQQMIMNIERELELNITDDGKVDELLKEKMALNKAKAHFAKYFGSVII